MNEEQQNFDELKRLLKLKRLELPPSGYFNSFSDQIVSRLRAGEAEAGMTVVGQLEEKAPWMLYFFRLFDARPGMAGGLAVSMCMLLLFGVVYAEFSESSTGSDMGLAETVAVDSSPALASVGMSAPALMAHSGGIVASTNPVTTLQPVTTMFGQSAPNPLFQSAGFMPAR
jgi:hypothetical protein